VEAGEVGGCHRSTIVAGSGVLAIQRRLIAQTRLARAVAPLAEGRGDACRIQSAAIELGGAAESNGEQGHELRASLA